MADNYHDQGGEDASNGVYDPPGNPIERIFDSIIPGIGLGKERDEYDAGWENTNDQIEENNSGCFITTACVDYYGLSDNCHELTTLRKFRDNYLMNNPLTKEMVKTYYKVAPSLVQKMINSPESNALFSKTYTKIKHIVDLIVERKHREAVEEYKKMFCELCNRFNVET